MTCSQQQLGWLCVNAPLRVAQKMQFDRENLGDLIYSLRVMFLELGGPYISHSDCVVVRFYSFVN